MLVFSAMETRVKRARVLSQNHITEIVMDSESDEENYACEEIDEEQPGPSSRCRVCSARGVMRSVKLICVQCDVALCVDRNCFVDYHTKDKL